MAQYYVISQDGQRYGPADEATLVQWSQQGRINAQTSLESVETGQRLFAMEIPSLNLAVQGPQQPLQPQPPIDGYYRPGYAVADNGQGDVTKAWIFGALALVCCPVIFGVLGIYFSTQAQKKGHPQAQAALIFCIVMTVLSMVAGAFFGFFR